MKKSNLYCDYVIHNIKYPPPVKVDCVKVNLLHHTILISPFIVPLIELYRTTQVDKKKRYYW